MKTLALIFLPLILEISWLGMQLLENRRMPEAFMAKVQVVPSYEKKNAKDCNTISFATSIGHKSKLLPASDCF